MRISAGTLLGDYQVVSLLGSGGMGEVYRARDLRLKRDVAIKVLSPALSGDRDAVNRFRREAEAASALNHPHIVTVHGFGEATLPDGSRCTYMVVELIEGRTLRSLINDSEVPRSDLLNACAQAAEGLAKAHAAGIVHRDLKPDNIMVSADGYAKILDFGLAKLHAPVPAGPHDDTTPVESQTDAVIGTAGYMAPEQIRGRSSDERSDIFALGCILYECVTRRRAFDGDSSFDILSKIVYEDPPPLGDEVPEPLARIVRRCLQKDPERRYQSARDLAIDLREQPHVMARVVERPGRAGHKTIFALAILAVIALAIALFPRRKSNVIESIVVLPFINATGDANLEYLTDGMTDALLNDLSRVPGLRVIARTTTFRYKNTKKDLPTVGRELRVDGVLAGQVRRTGENLVVDAELVKSGDDTRAWGDHYERTAGDALALQRQIAVDVMKALHREPPASIKPPTENRAAYDLYLKGRYFWNKRTAESTEKALALFNEATDADPTYARAYSGVADAYIARLQLGALPWRRGCERAQAAARRALELDPSVAEAHTSLGYLFMCCELDLDASEASFRRALELNPNYAVAHHWYAIYLVNTGRAQGGLVRMREASRLDPFSTQIQANVAFALVHSGHADDAELAAEDAIELDPNALYPYHMRGYVALARGDLEEAAEWFRTSVSKKFLASLPFLAYTYARMGDQTAARETLAQIDRQTADAPRTPALRAGTWMLLGDDERAFALLDEAFEQRDYWLSAMRISPPYDPLRNNPRYHDLLRRIDAR